MKVKKNRKGQLAVLLAAALAPAIARDLSAASREGYGFLNVPVSARAVGSGETSAAAAVGAQALYHNPAGIAQTKGWEIASHNLFGSGYLRMNNLSGTGKIGKSAIGVGVLAWSRPSLEGFDNAGNATGSFDSQDAQASLAFAQQIGPLALGATGKVIRSEIGGARSQGYAVDLGATRRLSNGITLGAAVLNLGPSVRYDRENADLPSEAKLGASVPVSHLVLSGEVTRSVHRQETRLNFGAELQVKVGASNGIALRSGYAPSALQSAGSGSFGGLRGGFGFQSGALSLDYAVSPFADLGLDHRVSVGMQFGGKGGN